MKYLVTLTVETGPDQKISTINRENKIIFDKILSECESSQRKLRKSLIATRKLMGDVKET
jgi:hypothetical protein